MGEIAEYWALANMKIKLKNGVVRKIKVGDRLLLRPEYHVTKELLNKRKIVLDNEMDYQRYEIN
jgi:hypothetical protein